jgi:hypothetical protein
MSSSSRSALNLGSRASDLRRAIASAVASPCFNAILLPSGAPRDLPPCILHRPLALRATDKQISFGFEHPRDGSAGRGAFGIGVTGNATANVADIQGTANQALVVNRPALHWLLVRSTLQAQVQLLARFSSLTAVQATLAPHGLPRFQP